MNTELTLDQLPFGQKAMIRSLNAKADPFRHKLLAMGVTPGCEVTVIRVAPLGDPIQIQIRGFQLCLRKNEASGINVDHLDAQDVKEHQ